MIALLEAKRAGLFARGHILQNIVAGLIVGVVALPLAMAFAIASGVKPEHGLYTAIIAGLAVSVFGGSRVQIAGPTGAFIVILAAITAEYGFEGLQIATLMGGCILLLMGALRLGSIIKFIPSPVIVGFTAGIGVIIFVGQLKEFFGLPNAQGDFFHETLLHYMRALPNLHFETTMLALMSLGLVLLSPRVMKRIPGPLVAMIVATALQAYFQFDGVATIGSAFGGIPQQLPSFQVPDVTLAKVVELAGPAFAIALLGAIESLLSAVVADGMAGTRHGSNQELIGQGIANIAAPLFGGFAATGAIARTATNIRNGGTSPLAGITHAAVLVLIILFLAPLASDIPLAALAAILFVVAYNMSEPHRFVAMARRAPRNDVIILLLTFFLTVFADLIVAVNVGVILATLLFMKRMASSVQLERQNKDRLKKEAGQDWDLPRDVLVYSVDGPFFFGVAETMQLTLGNINEELRVLVLRLGRVPYIDITGIQTLEGVIESLRKQNVQVMLCEALPVVAKQLRKAGLYKLVGRENVFSTLSQALDEALLPGA